MLAILIMLAAPAGASLTPDQAAAARKTLSDNMRDYEGSRFRGFHVVHAGEHVTLCGEANMRNAMGGLTGWQPLGIALTDEYPPIYTIGPDGIDGLVDFAKRCPYGEQMTPPAGATVDPTDVTAMIAPTPAS